VRRPDENQRTVWVVNQSSHDFSPATRFGKLRFLSKGLLRKRNVNFMARQFEEALAESTENDYLLPTSMTVMSVVASVLFAIRHNRLNLLIYENGSYKVRTLILNQEETLDGTTPIHRDH
jgi:hypothetical protein